MLIYEIIITHTESRGLNVFIKVHLTAKMYDKVTLKVAI